MTSQPQRGRPSIGAEHTKSQSLLLRLSPAEKQGFTDAAALTGLPLTVWMRERLRRVATNELEHASRPIAFLEPPKRQLTHKEEPMRLSTELIAYGISETPDDFRSRLIDTLLKEFPQRSIDSVVCQPTDAIQFCNMIRKALTSNPPDVVILKTLMNIRRSKRCPTGLKSPSSKKKLKSKLTEVGCVTDADEFRDLVSDCLADMYHSQTIDEVLCHPHEASALCNYIRDRGACDMVTDELILVTLLNNRKAPQAL